MNYPIGTFEIIHLIGVSIYKRRLAIKEIEVRYPN